MPPWCLRDASEWTLRFSEWMSIQNPSREVSSSHLIEIGDQFDIKLSDPLDGEVAYRSFEDVKRDIFLVDTE